MLPRHRSESERKGSRRFSQAAAARELGVTRWHLNRVLRGHRQSRSLRARYEALAAEIERLREMYLRDKASNLRKGPTSQLVTSGKDTGFQAQLRAQLEEGSR